MAKAKLKKWKVKTNTTRGTFVAKGYDYADVVRRLDRVAILPGNCLSIVLQD